MFMPILFFSAFFIISAPQTMSKTAVPTDLNIVISSSDVRPKEQSNSNSPSSPLKSFVVIWCLSNADSISPASLRTPS